MFFPENNAFFHGTLTFADTPVEVSLKRLGRVGSYTTAERWAGTPHSPEELELFFLLMRAFDDPAVSVRSQAVYYLRLLRDPLAERSVTRARRRLRLEELAGLPRHDVPRVWLLGPCEGAGPPAQGSIDLTAEYPSAGGKITWRERSRQGGRYEASGPATFAYFRLQSGSRQPALLAVHSVGDVTVWHNGPTSSAKAEKDLPLDLQPGSNDILCASPVPISTCASAPREGVSAALPERLDSSLLASRLKEAGGAEAVAPEFLPLDWPHEVGKGDPVQGRKLFGTIGCVKCHAIASDQKGGGGPSLAEARNRFTVPYLVESVLLPSKQVAEPFRGSVIATHSGQVLTGLVVNESVEQLELLLPDASLKTILKSEIEERKAAPTSPMPAGLVKTPQELRDLLAYLLSERPTPP